MIFFRLRSGRIINLSQIAVISSPGALAKNFSIVMSNGNMIVLQDEEAEAILHILTVYSVPGDK